MVDTQKFDLLFYQASALKESSSTGNNVRRAIRKSPQNASMIIYRLKISPEPSKETMENAFTYPEDFKDPVLIVSEW